MVSFQASQREKKKEIYYLVKFNGAAANIKLSALEELMRNFENFMCKKKNRKLNTYHVSPLVSKKI